MTEHDAERKLNACIAFVLKRFQHVVTNFDLEPYLKEEASL
jgi:hypothetical protein